MAGLLPLQEACSLWRAAALFALASAKDGFIERGLSRQSAASE